MPIPDSILNGLNFDPKVIGPIFYDSLATFLSVVKTTQDDGQETHTFATVDADHTNIPCRKSPLIIIRPQNEEHQSGDAQVERSNFQVNLNKFVGDASVEWKLSVDGVTYEIEAIEPDGSSLTTRVFISDVVPFNT